MKIHHREENRTKAMIMEAFLMLLTKRSYQDITIAQIAEKAKVGRRTFYRYFTDKDALVEAIVSLLMREFAHFITENSTGREAGNRESSAEAIALSYFLFWEEYIEELLLLDKAKLTYSIGDNLEPLLFSVARQSGHVSQNLTKEQQAIWYEKYKYAFAYRLAGYWRVTLMWCKENPRKSPEEMSHLLTDIMFMKEV